MFWWRDVSNPVRSIAIQCLYDSTPYPVTHRYCRERAAIRESAEAQPASNAWPGLSISMIKGA